MNPTRTESIKLFLQAKTHSDLAALYNINMEVQVNVGQDGGQLVEGIYEGKQWRAWTDGQTQWKSFRIPINAKTEPHYEDREMKFDLALHAEGIGMTGWDWKERKSRWIGFDFDAIIGHSEKHTRKLTDVQISELEQVIADIPWITLRKSTGGKGRHIYVFFDPIIETINHTEHAALARAVLGKLSAICGFDFFSKVDGCGGNMWVWHRKMTEGNQGLKLIRAGIPLTEIPANWRDHINVTSGRKRRSNLGFLPETNLDDPEAMFEELTGQRTRIPLDENHRRLINWLEEQKACWWWDQDHHMLITHTYHLKEAHEQLNLKGTFETNAKGSEKGIDHNCFAYPMRYGAWSVRRYTPGVSEATTWEQDAAGWTKCYFNREPDLATAARINEGIEHQSGGYDFRHAEQAAKAAQMLGANIELPPFVLSRKARIKAHKGENKIVVEFVAEKDDNPSALTGWNNDKNKWHRVIPVKSSVHSEYESNINYDDFVRHLVTMHNEDFGWVIKSEGVWRTEPWLHVKTTLSSDGLNPKECTSILGGAIMKAWTIVNFPFQPEYPGNRQWNRDAAQLRFALKTESNLQFPTWRKVFEHIGKNLNDAVKKHKWCQDNAILSGADYLLCWVASLFKEPMEPLPYLFLYGPQNSGKSIFHEALERLVTKGVIRADTAITSNSNFNAELENCIICTIEETDLKRNRIAYNRIKDWVTSPRILIHRKGKTPYTVENCSHWIQCSNEHLACPIFPGDSRIVMIHVEELTQTIPKKELITLLEKEASDFLTFLFQMELPNTNDRLNIPVVVTNEKLLAEQANRSMLETFLDDYCFYCRGHRLEFKVFYDRFSEWVDPSFLAQWPKQRVARELPPKFPHGRGYGNQVFVGNIVLDAMKEPMEHRCVCIDSKLEDVK